MSSDEVPPAPRLPARDPGSRRRAPRPRALTRDGIVDAALAIVDREGLDAMTMRTVAHALGTGAASLYAHVRSKEELLELVVERVIGEVRLPGDPDPARWREQVKELAREMRAVFASHRDLARASFARVPLGENALRGSEWMIGALRAGGIADPVVALACDLLPLYVMAIAYEEGLYLAESASPEEFDAFFAQMRDYFASLPVSRFPGIVSLAGPLTASADVDRFEFGLDVLLAGLEAISRAYQ